MEKYEKLYTTLKYYLLGKGYHKALRALHLGKEYHRGVRKDGRTPEFQHQLEIALYITTLPALPCEETVLSATLLHDLMEDYGVSHGDIQAVVGRHAADAVWRVSKKFLGVEKRKDDYFDGIADDWVSAIVKGGDRVHNVQSMIGVFDVEKQKRYLKEVHEYFIPMLKRAKYNFPELTPAFFNIMHMLRSQEELIRAMHGAMEAG